eukprot:7090020-Prymnesium_polylepis.1
MLKQPGHFTSMKKELGVCTRRLSLWRRCSSSRGGCRRSISPIETKDCAPAREAAASGRSLVPAAAARRGGDAPWRKGLWGWCGSEGSDSTSPPARRGGGRRLPTKV